MSIKIYKASAGSGKTYTLVYEYIRYMFAMLSADDIKQKVYNRQLNFHRRILAVTFTNKATAEMKERIVKGLYYLSQKEFKKNDYLDRLRRDLVQYANVEDDVIAAIAICFLKDILQDYTLFRVSTIDGFFQQIVRSFAKELNLNNQYKVELEQDKIFELAVDNMLSILGDSDKKMLLEWVTEFASEQVDNEKAWNPRSSILALAKLIQTERYVAQSSKLSMDINMLTNYKRHLYDIIGEFERKLKQVCDKAQSLLEPVEAGVFNKNKVSFFNFDYLKSRDYVVSPTFEGQRGKGLVEDWVTSKYKKDLSWSSTVEILHECVDVILDSIDRNGDAFKKYQTAKLIVANLYILGILKEIDNQVMDICRERDCLMISSTTDLIDKIIDNSDAPFIYEKVGVSTDNFMIDEFQDTSQMQWSNFVPLLDETLSRGEESMIVGDVKQSIYRWRNGDWRILHSGVENKFSGRVEVETLDKNFRSGQNVIEFNNLLFTVGKDDSGKEMERLPYWFDKQLSSQKILSENEEFFRQIYSDAKQIVGKPKNPQGYVRAEFFEKIDGKSCCEQSLDRMVERMKILGHYDKTAVLVREKKEAKVVAERLQQEGIPFYSTEALCVADNVAVRFIVAILHYLMQPQEHLYRANLLALYCEMCLQREICADDYALLAEEVTDYDDWVRRLINDDDKANEFIEKKYLPLLSTIEAVVNIFDLNNIDNGAHAIYIQSFLDKVRKFAIDGMLDIRTLLDYWNEYGSKSYISMPEGGDAVRIMTIHTSKGLEFGIVFLPFVDWFFGIANLDNIQLADVDLTHSDDHLFVEDVPIVPINNRNAQKMLGSYFDKHIKDEFLSTCLDTMNVLYVAATRASQQLYIHCYEPTKSPGKKESEIKPILAVDALRAVLLGDDATVFEIGDEVAYVVGEKSDDKDEKVENVELDYKPKKTLEKEKENSRIDWRFTYSEDNEILQEGVMMHKLFQQIETIGDVDKALKMLLHEGEIVESEVALLRAEMEKIFSITGVAELFDSKWYVLNEATIFDVDAKEECRPDRVMINDKTKEAIVLDYKFGYVEREKYKEQVERYVKLLTQMGYKTQGYILYAKKGKLKKV